MVEKEKYTVSGKDVLEKVKQLIREGNIRKVRLIHEGKTIIEIPLSVGAPVAVVGILAAPLLAAVGAFAALVTECTIEVEKMEEEKMTTEELAKHNENQIDALLALLIKKGIITEEEFEKEFEDLFED